MNRIKEKYLKEIRPQLKEFLGYNNDLALPRLEKAVVNVGLGSAKDNEKLVKSIEKTITQITGQKPVLTLAKKSVSGFKIRQGQAVGMKVTLRGDRMYDFIDKIISVALPRVRDFQGLDKKIVDQGGNLSLGFKEYLVFPEIDSNEISQSCGLEVNIVTNTDDRQAALKLFELLNFPFKKDKQDNK